jgi:hypothetical protein
MMVVWTLLWEEPQSILGALLLLVRWTFGWVERIDWANGRLFIQSRGGGVSLGLFVFYFRGSGVREHEYGHTFQSRWLGPLYLILVGIPSVSRVIYGWAYHRFTGEYWMGYFDGWPEKQADRLGGVTRNT